nr:unnamed protein product [Callosobruchus analis]CAI5834854.1 unnamed protein product [Callosobruchus analis]
MHVVKEGDRGYLEGLASRYADLFSTHYVDVLGHLEDLRRAEWDSARAQGKLPSETTPLGAGAGGVATGHQHQQAGMTNSLSQPIYVPGKYSPSSCLSDKEEDEIYGFGYGVFAAQIARQQQQRLLGQQQQSQPVQQQQQLPPTSHQPLLFQQHHNYQTYVLHMNL